MRKCLISVNVALPLSFSLIFPLRLFVSVGVRLWVFACELETRGVLCCRFSFSRVYVRRHEQKGSICVCKREWINWRHELRIVPLTDKTARAVSLYKPSAMRENNLWCALWTSAATLSIRHQWKRADVPQTHLTGGRRAASGLFSGLQRCRQGDICHLLCDWRSLTRLGSAHLANDANYAKQRTNDDVD